MKVSKEIRKNAVDYSMNAITDICTNIGPRESGMPKEREAQEWIKNQIDTNGWADACRQSRADACGKDNFAGTCGFVHCHRRAGILVLRAVHRQIFAGNDVVQCICEA